MLARNDNSISCVEDALKPRSLTSFIIDELAVM